MKNADADMPQHLHYWDDSRCCSQGTLRVITTNIIQALYYTTQCFAHLCSREYIDLEKALGSLYFALHNHNQNESPLAFQWYIFDAPWNSPNLDPTPRVLDDDIDLHDTVRFDIVQELNYIDA